MAAPPGPNPSPNEWNALAPPPLPAPGAAAAALVPSPLQLRLMLQISRARGRAYRKGIVWAQAQQMATLQAYLVPRRRPNPYPGIWQYALRSPPNVVDANLAPFLGSPFPDSQDDSGGEPVNVDVQRRVLAVAGNVRQFGFNYVRTLGEGGFGVAILFDLRARRGNVDIVLGHYVVKALINPPQAVPQAVPPWQNLRREEIAQLV